MDLCRAPGCQNTATTGPLCYVCEGKWMRWRRDVVDEALHATDLAARFVEWCESHGQPDPYRD